jgi:hypothetical protein
MVFKVVSVDRNVALHFLIAVCTVVCRIIRGKESLALA